MSRNQIFISFNTMLFSMLIAFQSNAQRMSYNDYANGSMDKHKVSEATIGSLICEDAHGNAVLCSGDISETILGIATNVPYITVNKPSNPQGSKFVFDAKVSVENGLVIHKGDGLVAGRKGTLRKALDGEDPYAVALENAIADKTVKIKIVKR